MQVHYRFKSYIMILLGHLNMWCNLVDTIII